MCLIFSCCWDNSRTRRNHCSVSEFVRILFVHQNFPGQYVHIFQRLAQKGQHQLVALGINPLDRGRGMPESFNHFRYGLDRGTTKGVNPLVVETETKIIRAEGCALTAAQCLPCVSHLSLCDELEFA